jgi:hypothetical protein
MLDNQDSTAVQFELHLQGELNRYISKYGTFPSAIALHPTERAALAWSSQLVYGNNPTLAWATSYMGIPIITQNEEPGLIIFCTQEGRDALSN